MKNLIEPKILEAMRARTVSYEEISKLLSNKPDMTATWLCKSLNMDTQPYYAWKNRQVKKEDEAKINKSELSPVVPAGGKKKYSAIDKMNLIKKYSLLINSEKAEFMRKFGLYQSDIDRWSALVDAAAIAALSTRKTRSDKKPEEQVQLELLRKEVTGQEKIIAKLAALVVIQKKVSEIIGCVE